MSPVETVMRELRKKIILAVGIIFAGLWLTLVAYLLTANKQPVTITPGTVAVHAPSPTGGGTPSATYSASRYSSSLLHHGAAPSPQWSYINNMPKASMPNVSMRIYQTSSATVHTIGSGGGSGAGIAMTSGGSGGSRGVRYTAMAYSGTIYVPRTSNAITEVGASGANEVATTTSSPRATSPSIRKVEGNIHGPFPDPIGDMTWGMMLLLAAGYGYHVFLRKRPQSKEAKR